LAILTARLGLVDNLDYCLLNIRFESFWLPDTESAGVDAPEADVPEATFRVEIFSLSFVASFGDTCKVRRPLLKGALVSSCWETC